MAELEGLLLLVEVANTMENAESMARKAMVGEAHALASGYPLVSQGPAGFDSGLDGPLAARVKKET